MAIYGLWMPLATYAFSGWLSASPKCAEKLGDGDGPAAEIHHHYLGRVK
jgi:hypothetical protein